MHTDIQRYIDLFRERTSATTNKIPISTKLVVGQPEADPFTVTDEELDEIQETGDVPYFLKYEAL